MTAAYSSPVQLPQILISSSRLTEPRRAALARLVAPEGQPRFAGLDAVSEAGVGAVLVDGPGPWPEPAIAALRTAVQRGLPVVAIGTDLFGARAGNPLPAGEVFATVVEPASPLARRTTPEFAVVDAFQPLTPAPGLVPVLSVSYGFEGRTALLAGRCGDGRVTVSGLGNTDRALASPPLATMLRRALRPALPAGDGPALGLGVVGYGRFGGMGYLHGTAADATDGLAFVAACDGDLDRRKAAEHDFPGIRVHATVEELAADDDVDVAVVATPPASHMELVVALLRAGRHVVCEKPLCFTSADANLLRSEAAAAGRVLTVHKSRRWDRDFLAVRRVVEGGELGQVFNVETFVGAFEHPCRAWHSEDTVSGGMAYDWGSHHLDWILQLMGTMPASVSAVGHKRVWHDVSNLDQLRVRLHWDDGREAEFLTSDVAAVRRPKFYVQGTAGTLVGHYRSVTFERLDPARGYLADTVHHAEAPADLTLVSYASGTGLAETRVPVAPEQPFAFHRNLADHLHLGDHLAVTAESAGQVVALLEAASQSAATGGRPAGCG